MISGLMVVVLAALVANVIWPPGNSVVDHAMQRYRFVHFAPDRPDDNPTLIVMLHGYGGSAEELRHRSDMDVVARQMRADVVYVQAQPDDMGIAHWNVGLGLTDRDDRDFLIALIRGLQMEFGFAPERTFIVGESNGAYMAFSIACEAEDLLGGIVSVIGTMSQATWAACDPGDPVPLLMIHGAEDEVITAAEYDGAENEWVTPVAIDAVAARWGEWAGAVNTSTSHPVAWALQTDWRDAEGRLGSRYIEISEMAHEWPRVDQIGIDGSAVAWRFIEQIMVERSQ